MVANSPIVTVDAAAFEQRSGQNVEAYLNTLPAYNPAASPTTMEDDIQPTAVNSVGIATTRRKTCLQMEPGETSKNSNQ